MGTLYRRRKIPIADNQRHAISKPVSGVILFWALFYFVNSYTADYYALLTRRRISSNKSSNKITSTMSQIISWTEPELCTCNFDLSRSWFVFFTVKNELTGQEIRRQFRGDINSFKTKTDRLREGAALKAFWKKKLEDGRYNPFLKGADRSPIQIPESVRDGITRVIALKKSSLKRKSIRNYTQIANMFLEWLGRYSYDKLRLYQLNGQIVQAYLDHLLIDKNYSGKSYNNQMGILKGFFNFMKAKARRWIEINPFDDIEVLPEDIGNNVPYNEREKGIIIDHLRQHDRRMFYAVNFVFHCFIRKTELTTIRVGDIDWENKTIKIDSQAAKNRIQDCVTIPENFLPVLYEMGLDKAPKHLYIFGKKMETCGERMTRPDDISDKYLGLKKEVGFLAGDGKTFYSWKHTGVITYWNLIKDPYSIMRQARHSDLKTTLIYLKSLGLNPNVPFLSAKASL